MASQHVPDVLDRLRRSVGHTVGHHFFATAALAGFAAAAINAFAPQATAPQWQWLTVCALLAYAAAASLAWWRSRSDAFRADGPILALGIGAIALAGAVAVMSGNGVRSSALGFGPVAVCIFVVITPLARGVMILLCSAAVIAGLGAAEITGLLPPAPGRSGLLAVMLTQTLAVLSAFAGGLLISVTLDHYLSVAAEREERFRRLLGMAVDGYWEQDAAGRFTTREQGPATPPWDTVLPAALQADIAARRPFRDVLVRGPGPAQRPRLWSVSGQPRLDAQGSFAGFWGIARDVTTEAENREAMAASEGRYRELFSRSPMPLVLHRAGTVIDANEAAARLFGFDTVDDMSGHDLVSSYDDDAQRRQAHERVMFLEQAAVGTSLPESELSMTSVRGRRSTVQVTSARVATASGPASLSIFNDITARVGAETALRRSESMLSQLFATSPDCITLTDAITGRYLLVNDAFTQMTGWPAAEAVGRTSGELGIWGSPADRERLLAAIEAQGRADALPLNVRSRDGALVPVLVSAARFALDGREHLVINARNVSDADRARLENEAMLRNASIGIAFTRGDRFLRVNPFFERMLGWPEGGLAGQTGAVVWPDEAAYAEVGRSIGPLLAQGRTVEVERDVRRRDGTLFLCRILAQAVDPEDPARGGTIWITEDVTERRQIERALASARDAAEAASRAKSAFLANTSHEIRTPLNGLLGLARLARQSDVDPVRRARYLDQIFDSAQSLAGVISDILDLSKIEAGKITLEAVPFNLRDTLASLHHTYLSLAEAKGLALTLQVGDTLPRLVVGDAVRLRQILANYITNALKFTERGAVAIEAGLDEMGWVRLCVRDTGPGIDAATQQRLFLPFSQADESTTRRYGGTGLGLSICRELAALMGGEVGLASAPGQGSSFWAALPLAAAEQLPAWADSGTGDPDILRGAHVLLVEDNAVNMLIGVAMLEQWGVDTTQASDGQSAIDAVERAAGLGRPFDAVLMDVQMPGMSGHEAARVMRRQWSAEQLPIIALTAAALVSERDEALAAGMNEFLTKPIDTAKLRQALMRHRATLA